MQHYISRSITFVIVKGYLGGKHKRKLIWKFLKRNFFSFFFWWYGVWTQGFARQALYLLSQVPNPRKYRDQLLLLGTDRRCETRTAEISANCTCLRRLYSWCPDACITFQLPGPAVNLKIRKTILHPPSK
jgi:hypothetical protein